MKRRQFALTLLLPLMAATVQAQKTAAPKTVGVFSLLGDSVQVATATEAPGDSPRFERIGRESLDFKGIGFDLIAIRTARDALRQVYPAAKVVGFSAPQVLTVTEQRELAASAAKAELPGWMVKTLDENQLSHLLLITRTRGSMDASTGDNYSIGRGQVEGIGFYLDTLYRMQNSRTGALSTGLLAPYVQVRLSLMDAQSGDVLASYEVKDAYAYASPDDQPKADPWSFMPTSEKITRLRKLVEQGLARGMKALLTKP